MKSAAEGKWLPQLRSETPFAAAARIALTERLRVVQAALPRAARSAHSDVEHVHRLRVGTRRARAALDLFRACLSEKLYSQVRRTLRQIRRAAGAARDADVFLLRLVPGLKSASGKHAAGLHWIVGQFCALRAQAQVDLVERFPRVRDQLDQRLGLVIGELPVSGKNGSGKGGLRESATPLVQQILAELEDMARGDLQSLPHLHQVRIRGKRLRYAIEVLAGAFPPPVKTEIYPKVEEMQDLLGYLNDHVVAVQALEEIREHARKFMRGQWPHWRSGINALLQRERHALSKRHEHFLAFWDRWQEDEVGVKLRELIAKGE